jgi:hypothetical protein
MSARRAFEQIWMEHRPIQHRNGDGGPCTPACFTIAAAEPAGTRSGTGGVRSARRAFCPSGTRGGGLRDIAGIYIFASPVRLECPPLDAMCSLLSFVALLPLIFLLVLVMFADIVGRADAPCGHQCAIDMCVLHTLSLRPVALNTTL